VSRWIWVLEVQNLHGIMGERGMLLLKKGLIGWCTIFPNADIKVKEAMSLDHCPLFVTLNDEKRGRMWHPTLPRYVNEDVLICILTPLMTTTRFKAMMVMISSELHS
jgi:hypothetical protein